MSFKHYLSYLAPFSRSFYMRYKDNVTQDEKELKKRKAKWERSEKSILVLLKTSTMFLYTKGVSMREKIILKIARKN